MTGEQNIIYENLGVNAKDHLTVAGVDVTGLATQYGTPLMIFDENRIRERCRTYKNAIEKHFSEDSMVLYAGKAFCCKEMYRIVSSEGIGADVVSAGELYTAYHAKFPMEKTFFHGNNKTIEDVRFAIDCGIGYFVVDNREELDSIQEIASERGIVQKILLRATPGIDPHTHAKISTGKVDSKFGVAVETGQIEELTEYVMTLENIELVGYHCHIGSQIFEVKPFCDAADIMLQFVIDMKKEFGVETKLLNLGGGLGVRYVKDEPEIDYDACLYEISEHVKKRCREMGIEMPRIVMEPGRSLVADTAVTVYKVGSVKTINGYKSYVSIDGGMTDNPRYALYGSQYTVYLANRMRDEQDFKCTVAGRCCESGDLIQEDIYLPKPIRGDILGVACTGAYNYSMASNYNRVTRPAVVSVRDGKSKLIIERETVEYMTSLDK